MQKISKAYELATFNKIALKVKSQSQNKTKESKSYVNTNVKKPLNFQKITINKLSQN